MPIAPPKYGLQTKVGWVLENSGNFQSNEYKNIPILEKKAEKMEVKVAYPPSKNYISEGHNVESFFFVLVLSWLYFFKPSQIHLLSI